MTAHRAKALIPLVTTHPHGLGPISAGMLMSLLCRLFVAPEAWQHPPTAAADFRFPQVRGRVPMSVELVRVGIEKGPLTLDRGSGVPQHDHPRAGPAVLGHLCKQR